MYFPGVVEQVEQHLLEQHDVELGASAGPAAGGPGRDGAPEFLGGPLAERCRRSPTDRRCWLRGATAPDSSRVMSRRLPMKRFSRSASSWIVAIISPLGAFVERPRVGSFRLVADPRMEASGVRRSWEMEVSRAEPSRSVSAASLRPVDVRAPDGFARWQAPPDRRAPPAGAADRRRAAHLAARPPGR